MKRLLLEMFVKVEDIDDLDDLVNRKYTDYGEAGKTDKENREIMKRKNENVQYLLKIRDELNNN